MRNFLIISLIIAVAGFIAVYFAFRADEHSMNSVEIHYVIQTSMQASSAQEAAMEQTAFLNEIINDINAQSAGRDRVIQLFLYFAIGAFALSSILLYIHYTRKVLAPFKKLEKFAQSVAAGNLDIPLKMDKGNLFGAFTESFDMMREELLRAKMSEIAANKSKKELVVSLAHDINTPVASARSAIDILKIKEKDEAKIKILDSASEKLEQIDALVTNLFHSTLDELQELKVAPIDVSSTEVYDIIKKSDYEGKVLNFLIPDCIVLADVMRLRQVCDNIIKNSYKYAKTDIKIKSYIEEEWLFIEIKDFGAGVEEKEIPLITSKFYRGANASKADGHGIGLYLSKSLLDKMQGGLYCENDTDGFVVVIMLKISGI